MSLLALDIETLGLLEKSPLPEITCACLYDGTTEFMLPFYNVSSEARALNAAQLIQLLDSADRIIGYNAVFFDLEFIKRSFEISEERMSSWVRKTIDPFMFLKCVMNTTSNLASLLSLNNLSSKTGTGLHAINLALEVHQPFSSLPAPHFLTCLLVSQGKNEELLQYCLMDAKLVYRLCQLSEIKIKNAQDQIATCSIDFQTGRWNVTEPPRSSLKHAKSSRPRQARQYPVVFGRIFREHILPEMILHYQSSLVNPEQVSWISFASEE